MKNNLYLIPGFRSNCTGEGYSDVKRDAKNKFNVIYSNINWKNSSITDWSNEFLKKYQKTKTSKNIVVGFSYGSMTALNTAPDTKPDILILCSLSPFFSEILQFLPKTWLKVESKKRLDAFKNTSLRNISSKINSETIIYLLVGEKELKMWPAMNKILSLAENTLNIKETIIIPNSKHRLDNNYKNKLTQLLNKL